MSDIFGHTLEIDPVSWILNPDMPVFLDVEDDEKGGFVGIGLFQGGKVYYFSKLREELKAFLLASKSVVGHNVKYDVHQLRRWGCPLQAAQIGDDTQLMSYCIDAAAESHSLKVLAEKHLGLKWSTYKEMTTLVEQVPHVKKTTSRMVEGLDGQPRMKRVKLAEPIVTYTERKTKVTLDKQPVEKVAAYCSSDVVATYKLFHYFREHMAEKQIELYSKIELPTLRVIYKMECRGIKVDVDGLKRLDAEIGQRIREIQDGVGEATSLTSNKQLAATLEARGIALPNTKKGNKKVDKFTLLKHKKDPFVANLLEFKKLQKLKTAFTEPLLALPTLPRVYPTFNQVRATDEGDEEGIRTGRLSCSNPNLQQIPARSDLGKKLRALFIPDDGKVLLDADLGQIEPRIMAHVSQDPFLLDAFRSGKPLYEALIQGIDGLTRDDAKTFWLAWSYGAGLEKLSRIFKTSKWKGEKLVQQLLGKMKGLIAWQEETAKDALKVGGASTLFGRFRHIPELFSDNFYEKEAGKRKAINTPIQGTAADIMKILMIELDRYGYPLQLVVHDEVVLSVEPEMADYVREDVERIMTETVKMSVPLSVEAHVGNTWREAKGG